MGKFLVVAVCALALSGCVSKPAAGVQSVGGAGGSAEVQEIRLSDGTRCAVMVGSYKAGITCDWKQP